MKKLTACILIIIMMLTGCTRKNGDIISTSVDLGNLQMNTVTGVVGSALRHTGDLTSLKTSEQVDFFICAPCVYSDGEMIYLIRNFPEELSTPTEYNDFAFGDDRYCFFDIEVYTADDLTVPVKTIELTELKEAELNVFWSTISYDPENDLFYLTCRRDGETILYTADGAGKLVSEKSFKFDTLHRHFVYDGSMYIFANDGFAGDEAALTVENIESGERKVITDNARLAFCGEDGVYYIAQILSEDYEYEYHLFRYDHALGEPESVMEVDAKYFTTGNTVQYAAYDCSEKALYLASNYEIIVLKDDHELSVLTTSDIMLSMRQLTGDHLLIGIGPNQVSLYEPSDDLDSLADQQVSIRVCCIGAGESEMFFRTAFDSVISKMNAAALMLMPWFNELHSNYMAERISDETAKKDLTMLYGDMLMAGDSSAFGTGENYSESKQLFRYRTIGSRSDVMPLPTLGDDYSYSADGMFLAVNPNSSNKDLAAAFMAYYLEMCLNSELGQPDEYFDTFDKAADSPITVMLENSVRRTSDNEWKTHVSDTYKKLLAGSITVEKAADESVGYLRMVRDE